jgi:tetratricopeptide (TPR) repeat protein
MNVQKLTFGAAVKIASLMDRLQMLTDLLAQDPNNQLARYGLAMEYSGQGNLDGAVAEFNKLLAINPDYANAYFMAAQALAKGERKEEARNFLQKGIAAASRTGNAHAQSEMQGFLDELQD